MMKKHAQIVLSTLLASCAAIGETLHASNSSIDKALLAHLQATYPKHAIRAVSASPVENLFHVVIGTDVATLALTPQTLERLKANQKLEAGLSTRYWIMGGRFFDSERSFDLRESIKSRAEVINVSALNLKDAIVELRGKALHTLYVFTDPLCPFCQKLHNELKHLTDIRLVTFLTPLATLHAESPEVAARIYCAANPTLALDAAMTDAQSFLKRTSAAKCDTPIARNLERMKTLFIKGTPTLFLEDGSRLVGYQSHEAIGRALQKHSIKTSSQVTVIEDKNTKENP